MKIQENAELKEMSFMKIGGKAKYLIEIENEIELKKILEIKEEEKIPIVILGDGSNTIFNDTFHNKVFVKIKIDEILKVYEDDFGANINVSAGTNWDKLVSWSVKKRLSGLELLSGIPGSVGAAPIQNIGAYGQEIKNVMTHLKAFDMQTKDFYEINNAECNFKYRDSLFKQNPGRFIITNISFRLSKKKPGLPTYKDLALFFLSKRNKKPSLSEIRKAVLEIRNKKLPNPQKEPNCGSFFKNPIISQRSADKLISKFKDMPYFSHEPGYLKLSGGWLIEKSGFKGKNFGNLKVSNSNALVLISNGKASFKELIEVKDAIIKGVEKNFGVSIETEPNLIW